MIWVKAELGSSSPSCPVPARRPTSVGRQYEALLLFSLSWNTGLAHPASPLFDVLKSTAPARVSLRSHRSSTTLNRDVVSPRASLGSVDSAFRDSEISENVFLTESGLPSLNKVVFRVCIEDTRFARFCAQFVLRTDYFVALVLLQILQVNVVFKKPLGQKVQLNAGA